MSLVIEKIWECYAILRILLQSQFSAEVELAKDESKFITEQILVSHWV